MEMADIRKFTLTGQLHHDLKIFSDIFAGDDIFTIRHFSTCNGRGFRDCAMVFFDGMIDTKVVDDNILEPMMQSHAESLEAAFQNHIAADTIQLTASVAEAVEAVMLGDVLVLEDGDAHILICSAKGYMKRSVEEPEGERLVRGPREGFTESLVANTALLRRKMLSPDLKLVTLHPFSKSCQRLAVAYLDSVVDRQALSILMERLHKADIELALDTRRLDEAIRDHRFSLFRTLGSTERPDIAAAKMMEGKILLMLDGTPVVSTLPFVFTEYFQTGDDYYTGWLAGSAARLLRITGFLLSLLLPSAYLALITYHQEIIPTKFLISIAAARSGVPFPTVLELFLMLAAFEILREGGSMMPGSVGQALSTVGAVVVGQAAVDARIISAPLVIVAAATGLCAMMTPKLVIPGLVLRTLLLCFSAVLGFFGLLFGCTVILALLYPMKSFGVPYMTYTGTLRLSDIRDTLIRAPAKQGD